MEPKGIQAEGADSSQNIYLEVNYYPTNPFTRPELLLGMRSIFGQVANSGFREELRPAGDKPWP